MPDLQRHLPAKLSWKPEDNRANESDNVLADSPRVRLAALADMFELINKGNIKSP